MKHDVQTVLSQQLTYMLHEEQYLLKKSLGLFCVGLFEDFIVL